jgi:hypothetical protein
MVGVVEPGGYWALVILAVIVVVPGASGVTAPVDGLMVATAVLFEEYTAEVVSFTA